MPGIVTQDGPFKTITIKELHPTFGAEISGCDFENMTDEQFAEIKAAMAKVMHPSYSLMNRLSDFTSSSMASSSSATQVSQMPNTSTSPPVSAPSTTSSAT